MKLEDKLLSLRKQQGLTQLELAEALHISRQAISKWETGEATPSLENLKSLSQLYQVPLGQLLGEDQPPVQPPQAEPKEETDGDPPAAELAGEKVPPGEISKPSSKRRRVLTAVLLGWAAVLSIGIVAGYLWWNSQPAQQFARWSVAPSENPDPGSLWLTINTIGVDADGSGWIDYVLYNDGDEVDYWGSHEMYGDCWVDYYYEGNWHEVYPNPSVVPMSAGSLNPLEPGQQQQLVEDFPAKTLAMPGRYRFCVENVGYVEFALFENGRFYDVLIGKGQGVF